MKCSVAGCNNDSSDKSLKKSFLGFPSDAAVAEKWITFCQRPQPFSHRYNFICRDHFVDDDFVNLVQYEMGFASHLKIKRGVVPTIRRISTEPSIREQRIERRKQKQIVNNLLREYNLEQKEKMLAIANGSDDICTKAIKTSKLVKTSIKNKLPDLSRNMDNEYSTLENNIHSEIKFEEVEVGNNMDYPSNVFEEVEELHEQIKRLRKENICLRRINKGLSKKLEKWKKLNIEKDIRYATRVSKVNVQLKNKSQECQNLEEKLKVIFTIGQINKMKSTKNVYHWNEEDIAKSVTLYASSGKTYKLLYDNGFPLPSVRTLQRWKWGHKIDTNKGVNATENIIESENIIKPENIVESENIVASENIIEPENIILDAHMDDIEQTFAEYAITFDIA